MKNHSERKALMNRYVIWFVIALQLGALGFIAGKREWIRFNGEVVYLRTAPVDPRDLFRGDYVQLEYDLAFPSREIMDKYFNENKITADSRLKQQTVYLWLNSSRQRAPELVQLSLVEPLEGPFMKAQIGGNEWSQRAPIQLGIEKYFVEQGAGLALEEKRGKRNDWQTAMEMEVALGSDGTAVIKGHRWSDLAVRIEVVVPADRRTRRSETDEEDENARRSPVLKVSLRNQSVQVVNLLVSETNFCEFQLLKLEDARLLKGYETIEFPNRDCANFGNGSFIVKSLAPDATHVMEVDLANPDWFVRYKDRIMEISDMPGNRSGFRWIYSASEIKKDDIENLWQSQIKTASFRASGFID